MCASLCPGVKYRLMNERQGLRVLIADDERPARRKIRRFLEEEAGVAAIHESWDVPTTLAVIREADPDLVFLDVEMPGGSGVELLETLSPDQRPFTIFVTAYERFALQAFDLAAVDYLLKPVDQERFRQAFRRAIAASQLLEHAEQTGRVARRRNAADVSGEAPLDQVMASDGERTMLVSLRDVAWLESDRNYVCLYTEGTIWRVRGTLAEFEARLDPQQFVRASRGTIINRAHVVQMDSAGHGDYFVRLTGNAVVRLSRRFAKGVKVGKGK